MKQRVKLSKTELIEKKPEKSKSDNTPSAIELAICIVGIYVCFLTWGITQERVTTTSYDGQKFNFFLILINFQAYAAALVALIFLFVTNKKLDSLDNGSFEFAKLTLLHTVAPHFGYAALKHIDYPTMILGKSCKLVPVMIMNFLLHGKRFPMYKYIVAILITIGVSLFMFLSEEDKGGKSGSLFGIALLTTNLVFDGAAVSTQDAIFRKFKLSGSSMMVYLNLSSGLLISSWLVIGHFLPSPYNSSELSNGIKFCLEHPRVFFDIIIFGFMGGIGQCFIFHTMERFGGVLLVTINVTRKMFSILLSAFYFQHVFSLGQWFSVFLVFVGIFLESFGKRFSGGEHVSEKVDTGKKEKKN